MSLIWSYIGQEVRKCSSVSTSFCGQCAHRQTWLSREDRLWQPFSIARLCSLSLYIVKAFLNFGQLHWSGILCLGPNSFLVCLLFVDCFKKLSCNFLMIWFPSRVNTDSLSVAHLKLQLKRGRCITSLCKTISTQHYLITNSLLVAQTTT